MKTPKLDDDWIERERLHRAAQDGDISEVRRLLVDRGAMHLFDDISFTPLHHAVQGEHYKVATLLLEAGAHVDAHEDEKAGETALGVAARGTYPEIAELLLKFGANPDIPGWMGVTARERAGGRTDEDGKKIAAVIERYRARPPLTERSNGA